MDDIERKITDALLAEASRVTEESLRLPAHIVRPRPWRWPALAAAAGVLATGAAVAGVLAAGGDRSEPRPMPPVPTTSLPSPVTSTTSVPPTSSSPPPSGGATSSTVTGTTRQTQPPLRCGDKPCQVVQTVRIDAITLELLAAQSSDYPGSLANWRVRVQGNGELPGTRIFEGSFVTADSLRCATVAGQSVCLVHTHYLGDADSYVGIVVDGPGSRFTGEQFPTPYGALRVDVRDLGGDRTLDVVAVENHYHGDEREFWTAAVWHWDGTKLGCAPRVSTKEELPDWPNVAPDLSTLDEKNCFP
jgi:hypothetical protein